MILKDFMVTNPISVHPDDSLYHASQIMAWIDARHLPVVVEDDRLVGILSERDILSFRTKEPGRDPKSTLVLDAMQEKPHTAGPDSSLTEVAARMAASKIGCFPVTQKGRLVGLVTRTDVLSAEVRVSMATLSTALTAADVMTRDPKTVTPDDFLLDAIKLMKEADVRHLPVVDEDGYAVGILSDRDVQTLIRDPAEFLLSLGSEQEELFVRDLMSRPPMRIWPDENCGTIASLFVQSKASAALVTARDGKLEGIISYVDLLRSLFSQSAEHPLFV